jgi:CheY-like chemotaxis protein
MILLVEDNEDDVFFMERAFEKASIQRPMHVAKDGREALAYLQAAGKYADRNSYPMPSLIFLDLKLPFVHGFQVLEWIRQQPSISQIPVIVLTSSPEQSDRDKAEALGAQSYLVKPPTPEMLQGVFQSFPGL